jgi:hypothetical protein
LGKRNAKNGFLEVGEVVGSDFLERMRRRRNKARRATIALMETAIPITAP